MISKSDLVQAVAAQFADLPKSKVEGIIRAFLENLSQNLEQGEEISLRDFGTFKVTTRKARTGHNPKTGEKIDIPEKNTVVFKASSVLKKAVN